MFPTVSLHDVFRLAIVRVSVAIRTLTGRLLPRFGFLVCTCKSWEKISEIRRRKFIPIYVVLNTAIIMCKIEIIRIQPII